MQLETEYQALIFVFFLSQVWFLGEYAVFNLSKSLGN